MKSSFVNARSVDDALDVLATAQRLQPFLLFSELVFHRRDDTDFVDFHSGHETRVATLRLPLSFENMSIEPPTRLNHLSDSSLMPAFSELLRYVGLSAAYDSYTEVHGHIVSLSVADEWVTVTIVDDEYGYAHEAKVELEISSPYEGLAFSLMEELDGEVKRRRRLQP